MAAETQTTAALVARLRRHERGARQQCQCSSNKENCMACNCGLAADVIELLEREKTFLFKAGDTAGAFPECNPDG